MDDNNMQGSNEQSGFKLSPDTNNANTGFQAPPSEVSGTYNAQPSGMVSPDMNGGMNDNVSSTYTDGYTAASNPFDDVFGKKAKTSMILGIVNLVLNLIFCCIPFVFDVMFSPGWLFIALEVWGIKAASQGKQSDTKKGMATAGMVMNIVALVWSILLVLLVLVLKFAQ